MSDASLRHTDPQRPRGTVLRPPLWVRWVLSFSVAAALLVALVRFVESNNSDSSQAIENPAGAEAQNREAAILVAQDQAPHTVRLKPQAVPARAIERAVRADMASLIAHQALDGPLGRSTCTQIGPRGTVRVAYRCMVVAGGVTYPFLGVVDLHAQQITYCKRDPPPVPSENIPVSRRCLAT